MNINERAWLAECEPAIQEAIEELGETGPIYVDSSMEVALRKILHPLLRAGLQVALRLAETKA